MFTTDRAKLVSILVGIAVVMAVVGLFILVIARLHNRGLELKLQLQAPCPVQQQPAPGQPPSADKPVMTDAQKRAAEAELKRTNDETLVIVIIAAVIVVTVFVLMIILMNSGEQTREQILDYMGQKLEISGVSRQAPATQMQMQMPAAVAAGVASGVAGGEIVGGYGNNKSNKSKRRVSTSNANTSTNNLMQPGADFGSGPDLPSPGPGVDFRSGSNMPPGQSPGVDFGTGTNEASDPGVGFGVGPNNGGPYPDKASQQFGTDMPPEGINSGPGVPSESQPWSNKNLQSYMQNYESNMTNKQKQRNYKRNLARKQAEFYANNSQTGDFDPAAANMQIQQNRAMAAGQQQQGPPATKRRWFS